MRFDPGLRRAGLTPFSTRFNSIRRVRKSLVDSRPQEASELSAMAQVVATERYRKYEELARIDGSRFHPATESVSEACIKFDDPAMWRPMPWAVLPAQPRAVGAQQRNTPH
jgi:hypothetical protein